MDKPDEFVERLRAFIGRQELLTDGQTVLVAVSGGADSVALARALQLTGRYELQLAHVNHGLRAQADADAEFVAGLAAAWKLPFHLEKIDTPALARQWQLGTEEAARRGRYDALATLAGRVGATAVAVAHHADDQVETILHRLVRGTHLRGLAGMPAQRPLRGKVRLVRPLLWARRQQVEEFCRRQEMTWVTDHTNAVSDFTRNFIRNELLPLLRARINVRADEAILRLAAAAGAAEDLLGELARKLFVRACRKRTADAVVLRLAPLRKAPPLLATLALRLALAELHAPEQALGQERFDDLLAVVSGQLPAADLPEGVRAERRERDIHLSIRR